MITTHALGATGYVPNCSGTYNPCTEILKAKLANIAITPSLQTKCTDFTSKCGKTGDAAVAAKSWANLAVNRAAAVARDQSGAAFNDSNTAAGPTATTVTPTPPLTTTGTIDPSTGLPVTSGTGVMDWIKANQTTVGIVALVAGGLLVWKLIK